MKKFQKSLLSVAVVSAATGFTSLSIADEFTEALTSGKAYGDFRLRYEAVDQDNALKDADGLTLRSRIGYTTGTFNGLSATIEVEDSRVVAGVEDFNFHNET